MFPPATIVQPRLMIGPVDDPYEREADSMAQQVVRRMHDGSDAADAATGAVQDDKEDGKLQMKSLAGTITPIIQRDVVDDNDSTKILLDRSTPSTERAGVIAAYIFQEQYRQNPNGIFDFDDLVGAIQKWKGPAIDQDIDDPTQRVSISAVATRAAEQAHSTWLTAALRGVAHEKVLPTHAQMLEQNAPIFKHYSLLNDDNMIWRFATQPSSDQIYIKAGTSYTEISNVVAAHTGGNDKSNSNVKTLSFARNPAALMGVAASKGGDPKVLNIIDKAEYLYGIDIRALAAKGITAHAANARLISLFESEYVLVNTPGFPSQSLEQLATVKYNNPFRGVAIALMLSEEESNSKGMAKVEEVMGSVTPEKVKDVKTMDIKQAAAILDHAKKIKEASQEFSGPIRDKELVSYEAAGSALTGFHKNLGTSAVVRMKAQVHRQGGSVLAAAPELESAIRQLRGRGEPLPESARRPMEQAFGANFGAVRVHADAQADQLNRSIQARAFAMGKDIFMREGEYRPNDRAGQELLAHELTHVVQQTSTSVIQRQPLLEQASRSQTLHKGARSVQVKLLQRKLNAAGIVPLLPLVEDGDFGATTELHVLEFQRRNGLSADGIVGPQTWRLLNRAPSTAQTGTQEKLEPARIDRAAGGAEPPWLSVARAEIGTKEIKGAQHNPRIVEYLKATGNWWSTDETPWCSGFVNWVMKQAGFAGSGSAKAVSWLDWGKRIDQPVNGAIGVISYGGGKGHVGFVVGKQGNNILLLGGNQGDQVKISAFSLSKFAAFVVPTDYTLPASSGSLQESNAEYGKEASFESTR